MAINENAVTDTLTPTTGTLGIVGTVNISSGGSKYQVGGVTTNALAWVNFNGVTTTTIRSSYNVSSVTRNATGDYVVNFTNALSDANYSAVSSCGRNGTGTGGYLSLVGDRLAPTTTTLQVYTITILATLTDAPYVAVTVFGN